MASSEIVLVAGIDVWSGAILAGPYRVVNAPVAIVRDIAPRVDAMVAPVVPYGFTGSMDAYPGAFTVPSEAYRGYVRAVLVGLARNGFKNIILINGHGGGQTAILSAVAREVGQVEGVRTLVVNWWSYCSDITLDIFGEDGGHAGDNEAVVTVTVRAPVRTTLTSSGPRSRFDIGHSMKAVRDILSSFHGERFRAKRVPALRCHGRSCEHGGGLAVRASAVIRH